MTTLLAKHLSLRGAAGRGYFLVVVLVGIALGFVQAYADSHVPLIGRRYLAPFLAVFMLWAMAAAVRRLQDAGCSGLWLLLLALPWVHFALILFLIFAPKRAARGEAEPAEYLALRGVIFLTVLVCLSRLVVAPVTVTGADMKPSLLVGDLVLAGYRTGTEVTRGDVVIYSGPSGRVRIARLIGLPGDRVEMRAGTVVLNGQPLPAVPQGSFDEVFRLQGENGVLPRCGNGPVGEGGICSTPRLRETLPDGRAYDVLDIEPAGPADQTQEFVVPLGHLFFLGDNRDDVLDSRFAPLVGGDGLVPMQAVVARADRIVFSAAGQSALAFWTWRPDRFFLTVQ